MKNFWKNFKIKVAVKSRVARIKKINQAIEVIKSDTRDNSRMIECLKHQMAIVDNNQLDMFDRVETP